jgi:hypothetical protein
MSIGRELLETIENINRYANLYIEQMYLDALNKKMYQLQENDLLFMVSEIGKNKVYLLRTPFYKWLLEQDSSIERTNALAYMWRHAFISHLQHLEMVRLHILGRPILVKFRKQMINDDRSLKYNEFSIDWISNYIKCNKSYICEYIDAGNLHLK